MIKIHNVDDCSTLSKFYLNLSPGNTASFSAPSHSAGQAAQGIVPVKATFEKLIVISDTAMSATSGYAMSFTRGTDAADLFAVTTYNVGTNALAADTITTFTATGYEKNSAMTHFEFTVSGTQGAGRLSVIGVFSINRDADHDNF